MPVSSPTTTQRDIQGAERLGRWAFTWGSPLKDDDLDTFGKQVLEAGAGLSTRDPEEIISTDLKTYEAGGYKFAVAQAEVTDLMQLREHLGTLTKALDQLRSARALDFALLMVTDVVRGSSSLVVNNPPPILDDLPYPLSDDGTRYAKGVVSRKKQLLPAVLGLLGN